jgi:hypothetical protein
VRLHGLAHAPLRRDPDVEPYLRPFAPTPVVLFNASLDRKSAGAGDPPTRVIHRRQGTLGASSIEEDEFTEGQEHALHGREERQAMRWFGARKRKKQGIAAASDLLVAGAAAFLSGRYVDHLSQQGDAVPPWTHLNVLAHGGLDELQRVSALRRPEKRAKSSGDGREEWTGAVQILAGEIDVLVNGDAGLLSHLQWHVLVPLEFELMSEAAFSAFDLVQFTRVALRSNIP